MELKFKNYIDLIVSKEGLEFENKTLRDMKNIIKKIHHLNKNGKSMVISFPKYRDGELKTLGNVVRVFAETEEELFEAIKEFEVQWNLTNIKISKIKEFKVSEKTIFYEFLKFHVPRKNNKSLKIGYREECKVKAENYPYVVIESSSTQQRYSLIIQRKICEFKQEEPNSYGLSSKESRVSIPTDVD